MADLDRGVKVPLVPWSTSATQASAGLVWSLRATDVAAPTDGATTDLYRTGGHDRLTLHFDPTEAGGSCSVEVYRYFALTGRYSKDTGFGTLNLTTAGGRQTRTIKDFGDCDGVYVRPLTFAGGGKLTVHGAVVTV